MPTSDKNKRFRNHCNIEVLLNKEESSVSVNISYKPELLVAPLAFEQHRYDCLDVMEELSRQGISTNEPTEGGHLCINNRTAGSRRESLTASYTFPIAPASSANTTPEAEQSEEKPTKKKRASNKTSKKS